MSRPDGMRPMRRLWNPNKHTGVPGIGPFFVNDRGEKHAYMRATYHDESGRQHVQTFSVRKHGWVRAFMLASFWRLQRLIADDEELDLLYIENYTEASTKHLLELREKFGASAAGLGD